MARPSFQFYPADWKNNMKLRICSESAKGAWVEILCVLHDCEEYGVFRRKLAELIRASGVSKSSAKELIEKGVLKGSDDKPESLIYIPRSGRKLGDPVTLISSENGPCWYSSRMVRDEYVRQKKGASGQFSSENQPEKTASNHSPMGGFGDVKGERQGDGAISSSSSSSSSKDLKEKNIKKENPVASAPKKKFSCPIDFVPDDTAKRIAAEKNIKIEIEFENFKDWHTAKGSLFLDWQAAFRTWIRRASAPREPPNKDSGKHSGFNEKDYGENEFI